MLLHRLSADVGKATREPGASKWPRAKSEDGAVHPTGVHVVCAARLT